MMRLELRRAARDPDEWCACDPDNDGRPWGFGATPWEASAAAIAAHGNAVVQWETLPWEWARQAIGIVNGCCEILGASHAAQQAIAAVRAELRTRAGGRFVDLVAYALTTGDRLALRMAMELSPYDLPGRLLRAGQAGFTERRRSRRLVRRALRVATAKMARWCAVAERCDT